MENTISLPCITWFIFLCPPLLKTSRDILHFHDKKADPYDFLVRVITHSIAWSFYIFLWVMYLYHVFRIVVQCHIYSHTKCISNIYKLCQILITLLNSSSQNAKSHSQNFWHHCSVNMYLLYCKMYHIVLLAAMALTQTFGAITLRIV